MTKALLKKPTLQNPPDQKDESAQLRPGSDINTVGFEIGSIGDSHTVAVNKFSFGRPHVMLVSSDGYRRQYEPLDLTDLDAAWKSLQGLGDDYVVFYNCGRDGGCSRLHKHMQLMPMPTKGFAEFLETKDAKETPVPFKWFHQRFDTAKAAVTSTDVVNAYNTLLEQASAAYQASGAKVNDQHPDAACPHNMILSKRWMLVLPRRQNAISKEAGANALGMLGVIAVATHKEIENWTKLGLNESLKILGVPRD